MVIIGIFVIMLLVLGIVFVLSTISSQEKITKKHLLEASLISESDIVETYARSFRSAVELSLTQAVYSSGTGLAILEDDFDSIYSEEKRIPYWQVYDSIYIPEYFETCEVEFEGCEDEIGFKEKMATLILRVSQSFIIDYFNAYKKFIYSHNIEIGFSGSTEVIAHNLDPESDIVEIIGGDLTFSKSTTVEDRVIDIKKTFPVQAEIKTKFVKMLKKSHDLIVEENVDHKNQLEECVLGATKIDDAQTCLNALADDLKEDLEEDCIEEEECIKVDFKIEEFKYDPATYKRYAVIYVAFQEIKTCDADVCYDKDFMVYDYLECENPVQVKNFVINFFVRVGDLIEYDPDQVIVRSIDIEDEPSFQDCEKGLGVISCKNICDFLPGGPLELKGCDEDEKLGPNALLGEEPRGIKPENPGKTCGPLCQKDNETYPPKKDSCEFSLETSKNNVTEYYCLGQAGSVEGETKYNCEEYCQDVPEYIGEYTSYCLETCSDDGGFCFCKDCELNFVKVKSDCFDGDSPYCEHGEDKIKVEATYSGLNCPSEKTFNLQIDSWNNYDNEYGGADSCLMCQFDYRDKKTTCNKDCETCDPDCDVEGLTVECNYQSCQTEWPIPEIPPKCWDKSIFLNTSFLTSADDEHYRGDTPLIFGYYLTNENFEFASCVDSDRNPSKDIVSGVCICVSIEETSCEDVGWFSCSGCDLTGPCLGEGGPNRLCCSAGEGGIIYGDSPTKGGTATHRIGDPTTGYSLESRGDYCSNDGKILYEHYCDEDEIKVKTYDCSDFCRPEGCPEDRVYGECWNEEGQWNKDNPNPAWCECICQPGNDIICHSQYSDGTYVSDGCNPFCGDDSCRWSGNEIDCMCAPSQVCYEKGCKDVSSKITGVTPSGIYGRSDTISTIRYTIKNYGEVDWTFLDEAEIEKVEGSGEFVLIDGEYPQNWDYLKIDQTKSATLPPYQIQCDDPLGTWTCDLYSYTDQSIYNGWLVSGPLSSSFEVVECNDPSDCHICLGDTDLACDSTYECCYPKDLEQPILSDNTLYCGESFTITCPSNSCPDCLEASTGVDYCINPSCSVTDTVFDCKAPPTTGSYNAVCTANKGTVEDCCYEETSTTYTVIGETENFNTDNTCSDGIDNDCDTNIDGNDYECQCRHPCASDNDCFGPNEICDYTDGTELHAFSKCHTCTIDYRQNSCKAFDEVVEGGLGIGDCELACGADLVCDEKSQSYSWCENNKRYDCSGCQQTEIEDCGDGICYDDGEGSTKCVELCPPGEPTCWIECTESIVGLILGGSTCIFDEMDGTYKWV